MSKHLHAIQFDGTTFGMEIDTDTTAWRKFKNQIRIETVRTKHGVDRRVPVVPAVWLGAIMREAHWLVTEAREIKEFYIEGFMDDRCITVLYDEKTKGEKMEESKILDELKRQYSDVAEEKGALIYIPVDQLYPHPDNPRKEIGDVSELAESIKAKGVMQNLTVVPRAEGGYTVIIGHRRCAAAKAAGLPVVPCVIVEMSEREQVATMLLENMQRVDLTAYEQAQGFQMMIDFGDTVEGIAEKTGFSKKTVKHRLEMAKLNKKTLKEVSARQITMEDFDKLAKIKSLKKRNEVLDKIGTANFNNAVETAIKEELIAEKMPPFVEKAKALGAKEMKPDDRYSGKFEQINTIDVTMADADKPLVAKKYQGEQLFYATPYNWGRIEIYRKRPKEDVKKRPKAEIEREKAIDECKKELKALTETAKVLRSNFVKGLIMNSKNRDLVLSGAVKALEVGVVSYLYSVHAKPILEFIGEETSNNYDENQKSFHKVLREKPGKAIPAMIYLHFENDPNEKYYMVQSNDFPKHYKSEWLDALYEWLISLGYEMSDDEKGLMDGTHPIFKEGV